VTGPLAHQFAQLEQAVEDAFRIELDECCTGPKYEASLKQQRDERLAALSVIERHVQDMEKALVELLVVAQTDDPWLIGGKRYRELLENARAALSAREKGTE
jgi:hypothetical protein